jgi:4-carboxymuconolactone decarboxylase
MARLPDPLDTLTPEAKQVYEKITAKRGAVRGPFASLMHHPALAERVGDLGEYLRFGGTLPGDIRELAILITARSVGQGYEWIAHAKVARKEGLADEVIERVRARGDPSDPPCPRATPARRGRCSTCWPTSRSRRICRPRCRASWGSPGSWSW